MKPASKLLKLKEWLTLDEAANYLSALLEEKVTEPDILRLALDNHLKLSVNFVNQAFAMQGQIIPTATIPLAKLSSPLFPEINTEYRPGIRINDHESILLHYEQDSENNLHFKDHPIKIDGIWELTMIGSERFEIEGKYQAHVGGPSISLGNFDGIFVRQPCEQKIIYQIQERAPIREYPPEQKQLKSFFDSFKFQPVDQLPKDCSLVITTKALRDFEQSLSTRKQREQAKNDCKLEPPDSKHLIVWLKKEDNGWDKLNRRLELQTGTNMFDLALKHYFEYENWKLSEALLLLAGITPKATLVNWNYVEETHEGAPLARFKIDVLNPIKFISVCEHPLEKLKEEEPGFEPSYIKNWNSEAEKHSFVISHYRNKLEKIADLWERTAHPNNSLNNSNLADDKHRNQLVSKEYATSWALSKGLEVIWLEWATNRGYLTNEEVKENVTWEKLSPPKNSGEFALLCYEITNSLERIPERKELARLLIQRFGKSHNIIASNRSGESLIYDGTPYKHDALNKVRKRISSQLK